MFEPRNLSVLAYANGFTLWHYTTTETHDELFVEGYFDAAGDMLRTGDMVLVNFDTNGTPGAAVLMANVPDTGTVNMANLDTTHQRAA